jgi:hypothetical protein
MRGKAGRGAGPGGVGRVEKRLTRVSPPCHCVRTDHHQVCLSTRAEKDMWLQALKTGISLTSSGDGACRSPRKCSQNDAKARRGSAPALTRTRPAEKEEAAAPATVAEKGLASPVREQVGENNSAQNVAALRRFGGSCSDGLGYVES